MDDLYALLPAAAATLAGVGGFLLGRKRREAEVNAPEALAQPQQVVLPEDAPVDVGTGFGDVKFSLQRHKHVYDTMFGDGVGMRCGIEVEPGTICGRPRFAKRGTPVG